MPSFDGDITALHHELQEKELDIIHLHKEIQELKLENKLLKGKVPTMYSDDYANVNDEKKFNIFEKISLSIYHLFRIIMK